VHSQSFCLFMIISYFLILFPLDIEAYPAGTHSFSHEGSNLDSYSMFSSGVVVRGSQNSKLLDDPSDKFTLIIGKTSAQVERLGNQGTRSFVYRVIGGWHNQPAIAKTVISGKELAESELKFLKKVGQYIDSGSDKEGRYWLIMKDVKVGPPPMFTLAEILGEKKDSGKPACYEAMKQAKSLTISESTRWAEARNILHLDLHPGNVFFDEGLTKAVLIDWGEAKKLKKKVTSNDFIQQLATTVVMSQFKDENIDRYC